MQIQANGANVMNGLLLNTVRVMGLPKNKEQLSEITSLSNKAQIVEVSNVIVNQFGEIQIKKLRLSMTVDLQLSSTQQL
jgi:hypothetical protein